MSIEIPSEKEQIDLFGNVVKASDVAPVKARFLMVPFTILNSSAGDWQVRKRHWVNDLKLQSELSREDAKVYTSSGFMGEAIMARGGEVSIFDPVLCELAYRWFAKEGGIVVDPFAGGSVRGIVASCMGLHYWGCDLRKAQIDANDEQAVKLLDDTMPIPIWVTGDADVVLTDAPECDFVFSCPPYGDLEVYSDDPADLSNMEWSAFVTAYYSIIKKAIAKLRNDRFACFVVGDFRDDKGFCRNFVSLTIDAFEKAGAKFYNEAILQTPVGTGCIRASKQFTSGRKLIKTHQNVLVFCKGDPKVATEGCVKEEESLKSALQLEIEDRKKKEAEELAKVQ